MCMFRHEMKGKKLTQGFKKVHSIRIRNYNQGNLECSLMLRKEGNKKRMALEFYLVDSSHL